MEVIRGGRVFDGDRFGAATDVVVDGGKVVAVGPAAPYPDGTRVTDHGADATVLPGLVDAHQHLTWDCSEDPLAWFSAADDAALLQQARRAGQVALAAGITTVRDVGDRAFVAVAYRQETAADPLAGPGVVAAGPPVTTPGGHCWFLGGGLDGAAALRDAVARHIEHGADLVKVMVTGGNVTPGSPPHLRQYQEADLRLLVEASHAHGLPVAAHAHGADGVAAALAAEVDTIEHATFMSADGIEQRPRLVAQLVEARIPVVITPGLVPGTTAVPAIAARMAALRDHISRLVEAGAYVVLATDAGIAPGKPHDVLPHAVAQLADAGISVESALHMATGRAADVLRLSGQAGRVRAGEPADLLVVDGDPRNDPGSLRRVLEVRRRGRTVPRAA